MRKVRLAAAMAVIAIAAGASWLLFDQRPITVHTVRAETGPAVELVYATGYVEPDHPVTVSSRVTAPVVSVLAEEGQAVTRGQPLATLDNSQQQALLAQAAAQARGRTLDETRTATLFAQGWVTRSARDAAVATAQAARAAEWAARAQLDQMTLNAGISGIVLKREVEPGDLATPGKELFQLGDPARARVTATVDERDITRVRPGQQALLSTDALPNTVVRGHIREITPGGDPGQRAFRVRIGLDGAISLPFGLTLEVNIVTRRHEHAVLVPAAAISEGRAWLVKDGRARQRQVRTGIAGADKVEVVSGLAAGDTVIVNPPADLKDGDRVRP